MTFQFVYTQDFKKHYNKMSSHEKKQITRKLALLSKDPTHPSLRTRRIKGADKLFECSVNMDIRIIWYYEGDKMIILIDIGHHDILKQF